MFEKKFNNLIYILAHCYRSKNEAIKEGKRWEDSEYKVVVFYNTTNIRWCVYIRKVKVIKPILNLFKNFD